MAVYRHNDWSQLVGAFVEVRKNHRFFRVGFVEDVMPDSSALWLAADANQPRILVHAREDYTVWVEPRVLEGKLRYRMATPALRPRHTQNN